MSDATTYANPAVLSEAVRTAMDAGDVADLCRAIGEEMYAKGFEAGRREEQHSIIRQEVRRLLDRNPLDSPGRGDGAVTPEPSPSLTPPATAVNDAAGTPPGQ